MKFAMRMMMAGLLLAGCGGDDDAMTADRAEIPIIDADTTPTIDADTTPTIDSDIGPTIDAGPHVCLTEADYGAATLMMQSANSGGGTAADPDAVQLLATLNGDATPDLFALELYKGFTVFSTNIHTGTFSITGQELDYATCGVCPRIFTDYDPATMMTAEQQYFATGGSVSITSITPNMTGTVNNLTYEEVTINPTTFESTPVPGGCQTAVMSGAFDIANQHTP